LSFASPFLKIGIIKDFFKQSGKEFMEIHKLNSFVNGVIKMLNEYAGIGLLYPFCFKKLNIGFLDFLGLPDATVFFCTSNFQTPCTSGHPWKFF
jgi:hypothetical protein